MELNKIYYYLICLFAIFVFMWGAIDLAAAGASFVSVKPSIEKQTEEMDGMYQKRVALDRLFDALARIAVSGAVFIYCRKKV